MADAPDIQLQERRRGERVRAAVAVDQRGGRSTVPAILQHEGQAVVEREANAVVEPGGVPDRRRHPHDVVVADAEIGARDPHAEVGGLTYGDSAVSRMNGNDRWRDRSWSRRGVIDRGLELVRVIVGVAFAPPSVLRAMRSSCLKRAALLRQLRLSINGVPEEYSPGSRSEWVTSDIAVTTTRSQTSRCPRMPAPPPIRQ